MTRLVDRIVELHVALRDGAVPHAFGGALALAWCTQRARGTIDIDVNVFVPIGAADGALGVFPPGVSVTDANRAEIDRDGQTRLWWDDTPVDVFFDTSDFHTAAAQRAHVERFAGHDVPFLACRDIAVFKVFSDRTKDWADLEEMADAGTLDIAFVLGVLVDHLGADDHRIERLRALGRS